MVRYAVNPVAGKTPAKMYKGDSRHSRQKVNLYFLNQIEALAEAAVASAEAAPTH